MAFLMTHGGTGFGASNPSGNVHGRLDGTTTVDVRAGNGATLTAAGIRRDDGGVGAFTIGDGTYTSSINMASPVNMGANQLTAGDIDFAGAMTIGDTSATSITIGQSGVTTTIWDLVATGTTFSATVGTVDIQDNIILLNDGAGTALADIGWVGQRHPDDLTAGTATETETAQAGAATTITLEAGANGTDDYYNNWWIEITGGTGSGQIKKVTDYVGATKVATVDSAWSTNPDATSVYALFDVREYAGLVWDESAGEFVVASTATEPGVSAALSIDKVMTIRSTALKLDETSDPANVTNTGFVYTKDDGGDTELFYRDDDGNIVQITADGQLNSAAIPGSSLDAAYTVGRSITQDLGPISMSGDSSTAGGMISMAPNVAAETSPQLAVNFQEISGTGIHTGLKVDYSQMTSLSNASTTSGVELLGITNSGAGESFGVKIDANFDQAVVIGSSDTVKMSILNEGTTGAEFSVKTIDGTDGDSAGMTFQTGNGAADEGSGPGLGGIFNFVGGNGEASTTTDVSGAAGAAYVVSLGNGGNSAAKSVGTPEGGAAGYYFVQTGNGGDGALNADGADGGRFQIRLGDGGAIGTGTSVAGGDGYFFLSSGSLDIADGLRLRGGMNVTVQGYNFDAVDDMDIDLGGAFDVLAGDSISLDATAASNFTTGTGDLTLSSTSGSVNITGGEAVADSVKISTAAGGGIDIDADTAGLTADSAGAISLDAAAASNFTITASDGSAHALTIASTNGGAGTATIDIDADEAITIDSTNAGISLDGVTSSNFTITANDGSTQTLTLAATNAGAGVGEVDIDADGAITIDSGAGVSIDGAGASNFSTTSGNITVSTADLAGAANITANSGGINLDASNGGAISLDATGTSNFTTNSGEITIQAESELNLNASTGGSNVLISPGITTNRGIVQVGTGADSALNQVAIFDGGGTDKAAELVLYNQAGTAYTLWVDANGDLRIESAATKTSDSSGAIVGAQGG